MMEAPQPKSEASETSTVSGSETRMGQSGVIAQSKLHIVKCNVGFFTENQRGETRLLVLQELVQGSRNGGQIWNCSPVEIYCTQKDFRPLTVVGFG